MTDNGNTQRRGRLQPNYTVDGIGYYPNEKSRSNAGFNTLANIRTKDFSTYNRSYYSINNNPVPSGGGGSSVTTYYRMRAIDPDCGSLTYRTWTVTGSPDYSAASYSDTKCGSNPLTNVIIAFSWTV
jgi:hypothetical protein